MSRSRWRGARQGALLVIGALLPLGAAAQARLDPVRARAIDSLLARAVDSAEIAGAVGLVLIDGRVAYERAVGWSDREARRPMTADALFRIASQTKALTSVAIVQLIEAGRIGLDDPVSRWIPSYARVMVASRSDTGRVLTPAARAITIRMLLTHTAGISYGTDELVAPLYAAQGFGPTAGFGWYFADKREPVCTSIDRLATLAIVAQPGERFVYGYNTDILGCVVERASGLSLDEYLRRKITGPLGMRDTWFYVPSAQRARLTTVYAKTGGSLARAVDGPRGQGDYVDGPRVNFSGGAGLVSTARDYARFLQAMLQDGQLGSVRILSRNGARLLHTNLVGTRYDAAGGMGFGAAFETTERFGAQGLLNERSYGWGGAYGSWYRVDPSTKTVMVFMQQTFGSGGDVRGRFGQVVQAAMIAPTAR
ncbi:MAG: beta-lactamase family protein [Gemmatimonadaceae bacterium]|nr:beta-lactamase family protein [Gemmatimonadaceae bacterium]